MTAVLLLHGPAAGSLYNCGRLKGGHTAPNGVFADVYQEMTIMGTTIARELTTWNRRRIAAVAIGGAFVVALLAFSLNADEWTSGIPWPEPAGVDPGPVGGPPSDAIVLFDGKSLSKWSDAGKWKVQDGCAISGGNDITTKQSFGDCQLHVEWATPEKVEGAGQGRGNSGVFLMGLYEVQILDSYNNKTYYDGQAASIYKQHPPLVNVCRKPGQWQTYDVVFEAPRFDKKGSLARPAFITVFQNGVLVQNHFQIQGETAYIKPPKYTAHAAKLPIILQYHGNPVRFRNIWIRELPASDAPPPAKKSPKA